VNGVRGETPLLQAVSQGILAPNPHNTQAWRFRPLSDVEALLYIDEHRLLPETDPPGRQIHIGAGCCIETLAIGMSTHGYATNVEYLPEGAHELEEYGRKPVARIRLIPGGAPTPDGLAEFILVRQTNRKPYQGPFLTPDEAARIRSEAADNSSGLIIITRPEEMRPLLDIFYRAWEIEATTPRLYEETRIWFRFDEKQRRAHRDGLSVPQLGMDGVKRRFIEFALRKGNPKQWFSPRSIRSSLKSYRTGIESARGVILLTTRTNEQLDWLRAGRAFARLGLVLTRLGLTSHPYSQVLEEFPEMAELQAEFNDLVGVPEPEKVQMAIRVGRAERAYPAPRRDPRDVLGGESADA
jgi:hypothetical protein